MDWEGALAVIRTALPALWPLAAILAVSYALVVPLPRRGPRLLQRQDPWRRFKGDARREVMERAGRRCEGAVFLVWGRCTEPATEADHIYPWSKYGPTVPSNGQALCSAHNRHKAAMRPPWWYVLALEHRRRVYFPTKSNLRVDARATSAELATHVKR